MDIEPVIFQYPHGMPRSDLNNSLEGIRNGSIETMALTTLESEKRLTDFSFSRTLYKVKQGVLMHETGNRNMESLIS